MITINIPLTETTYVYHYTSAEIATKYILKDKRIRFNPFENVNDPREYKQFEFTCFMPIESHIPLEEFQALTEEMARSFKRNVKVACFSLDRKIDIESMWREPHTRRGWARPSMWHHYAAKHNGLCLIFNRERLGIQLSKELQSAHLISGKVEYSNRGAIPNLSSDPYVIDFFGSMNAFDRAQMHLSKWASRLYFRKLEDWSNETEYRWVYLDASTGPRDVPFGDSLEAVVVGENVDKCNREAVNEYCKQAEIEICTLNWKNGFPYPNPVIWARAPRG